jgi:hypothetical protein
MGMRSIAAVCLSLALGLGLFARPAAAWETTVGAVRMEISGSLNVRGEADRTRKRSRAVRNNAAKLYNVLVLNARASTERHAIVAQVRPYHDMSFDPGSDHYSKVSVDELYWEARVTDYITTVLGRKRIVNGVALGYNPTDFLSHDKLVTSNNLEDTERRSERVGDNLVGFSKFFEDSTFSAFLLFPSGFSSSEHLRGLAQFSQRLEQLQTDYTLLAYYDDNLQLGLNISSTLTNSITGYLEMAISQNRGRRIIDTSKGGNPYQSPALALGSYQNTLDGAAYPPDYRRSFKWERHGNALELDQYDAVIGMQYTHESGIGLNVEYWRSNMAYSQREFNAIWDNVELGRISVDDAEDMLTANNNVQRDKIFVRVSDIPLIDDVLSLEQTNILGLNDESLFSRTSLIWQVSDSSTARLNLNHFNGNRRSEFGMVPYEWQIFSSFKYQF